MFKNFLWLLGSLILFGVGALLAKASDAMEAAYHCRISTLACSSWLTTVGMSSLSVATVFALGIGLVGTFWQGGVFLRKLSALLRGKPYYGEFND